MRSWWTTTPQAYASKAEMPAPLVFFDGREHWLADGFHRLEAAGKAGRRVLECEVKRGSLREAILHAAGANALHGLRRTNADKRGAVLLLLRDDVFKKWSDRKIGDACVVDHKTVGRVRQELGGEFPTDEEEGSTLGPRRSRVVAAVKPTSSVKVLPEVRQVLREKGLSEDVSEVRAVAKLAPELQERVAARLSLGSKTVKDALDQEKRAELWEHAAQLAAEPPPLPEGPFDVVAADPPWAFENRNEDASHRGRVDYAVMSLAALEALPVSLLAKPDAMLFLWVPNALLEDGLRLVKAWGFVQKTVLTWDKELLGLGNWLRNTTEQVLVAVRGSPQVLLSSQTTLIHERRRAHSQKPEAFYAHVESLCPGSKVELFARTPRAGWVSWGAEKEKFRPLAEGPGRASQG